MGKELTESALLAEMIAVCGMRRTLALLGVAFAAAALGVQDHHGFINMAFGSLPSRYRWWDEFRLLRDRLVVLGYDLSDVPDDLPVAVVAAAAWRS